MSDPSSGPSGPDPISPDSLDFSDGTAGFSPPPGFEPTKASDKAAQRASKQVRQAEKREDRQARGPRGGYVGWIVKGMAAFAAAGAVIVTAAGAIGLVWAKRESPESGRDRTQTAGLKPESRELLLGLDPPRFGPSMYEMAPVKESDPNYPEWLFSQAMQYFTAGYGIGITDVGDQPDRASKLLAEWFAEDPEKLAAFEEQWGGPLSAAPEDLNPPPGSDLEPLVTGLRITVASGLTKAAIATDLAKMAEDGTDALCTTDDRSQGLVDLDGQAERWARSAIDDFNEARLVMDLDPFEYNEFAVDTCKNLIGEGGGRSLEEIERGAELEQRSTTSTTELPTTTEPEIEGASYGLDRPVAEPAVVIAEAQALGAPSDLTAPQAAMYTLMAKAAGRSPATARTGPENAVAFVRQDGSVDVQGIA